MLEVRDIHVHYGRVHALKGVSLQVAPGKIVAVLGANGAGKSTLLAAISGLVRLSRGTILLDGRPLDHVPPHELVRRGVSHVPERRELFPEMTVVENLEMGAYGRSDRTAVRQHLDLVLTYFPLLAERRRQLAGTLSGGEQQMLAIGRGLMSHPRLLLLDEPSLGLAPVLVDVIFEIIRRINRESGTAILLVEQNTLVALEIATYGYVLETGRLAAADTSQNLLRSDRVRQSYLGA